MWVFVCVWVGIGVLGYLDCSFFAFCWNPGFWVPWSLEKDWGSNMSRYCDDSWCWFHLVAVCRVLCRTRSRTRTWISGCAVSVGRVVKRFLEPLHVFIWFTKHGNSVLFGRLCGKLGNLSYHFQHQDRMAAFWLCQSFRWPPVFVFFGGMEVHGGWYEPVGMIKVLYCNLMG